MNASISSLSTMATKLAFAGAAAAAGNRESTRESMGLRMAEGEELADDLTLTTETHLSSAELDEINQSAEMQCLLQEHSDTTTFGNNSAYCLTQFDSILCWPRTVRGTLAALPCLDEFQGIQYDSSRKLYQMFSLCLNSYRREF